MPAAARRSLAPLAVLAMLAGPARATTFVGVSERILARAADAIVIGTVEQIETVAGGDGTISTLVTLDVEEALKGHVERRLTLKQPGGSIGGRALWIAGGPRFRTGERQLLFLSAAADGTARTTALGMGQFVLRPHPRTGATLAERGCDGISQIVFDDPFHEMPNPVACSGVLALGGYCTSAERDVVNGKTFYRITEGNITFNQGFASCPFWNQTNLAEVATHELGHTIGIGHSSEEDNAPPVLKDATMYYRAHFDGRGASVHADDIAAVRFLYPGPGG